MLYKSLETETTAHSERKKKLILHFNGKGYRK